MATRCRHCIRSISVHSFGDSDCFAWSRSYDPSYFSLLCPVRAGSRRVDYGWSRQDVPLKVESCVRGRWSVEHRSRNCLPCLSWIGNRDPDLSVVHRTLVRWYRGHSNRSSGARAGASHRLRSEKDLILDLDHESENRSVVSAHYPYVMTTLKGSQAPPATAPVEDAPAFRAKTRLFLERFVVDDDRMTGPVRIGSPSPERIPTCGL